MKWYGLNPFIGRAWFSPCEAGPASGAGKGLNPFIGRAWFSPADSRCTSAAGRHVSIPLSAGLGFHSFGWLSGIIHTNVSIPLSAGLGFHCCAVNFDCVSYGGCLNPFIGRAWFSLTWTCQKKGTLRMSQSLYRQGLVFTINRLAGTDPAAKGLNPFIGRAWFSPITRDERIIGLMSQSLYRQGLVFTVSRGATSPGQQNSSQSLYRQGLVFTLLPQPDDSQGV